MESWTIASEIHNNRRPFANGLYMFIPSIKMVLGDDEIKKKCCYPHWFMVEASAGNRGFLDVFTTEVIGFACRFPLIQFRQIPAGYL